MSARAITVLAAAASMTLAGLTGATAAEEPHPCETDPSSCFPAVEVVDSETSVESRQEANRPEPHVNRGPDGVSTMGVVGRALDGYRWKHTETIKAVACTTGGSSCLVVGQIYTEAKYTLNGRQSTFTMSSQVMSGPDAMMTHKWKGYAKNGWAPDTSFTGGWVTSTDTKYDKGHWSEGQYFHKDADDYYYNFGWSWKLSGWTGWVWNHPTQTSLTFRCGINNANCVIP